MNSKSIPDSPQLILICAGSTDLDEQGRIVGRLDVPISENGLEHARLTAASMDEFDVNTVYCSPCIAAQQSAEIFAEKHRAKLRVEEALVNIDHGLWHGKLIKEVKETQPKLYRLWKEKPDSFAPPEGESGQDVRNRVAKLLQKICKRAKSATVAIVTPEPLYSLLFDELQTVAEDIVWICFPACETTPVISTPPSSIDAVA